jgi:hypothetical protein
MSRRSRGAMLASLVLVASFGGGSALAQDASPAPVPVTIGLDSFGGAVAARLFRTLGVPDDSEVRGASARSLGGPAA